MDAYLMLALAEGLSPHPLPALLDPGLDPSATLRDPPLAPQVPPRAAARLRDNGLAAAAAAVRAAAAQHGQVVLTPADPDYPAAWRAAPLRPLALFVRGDPAALQRTPAVAMVGSRTPTPYGDDAAEALGGALARAGVALWSGLARGIDAAAHRACVAARVPTVAILAGGLDVVYPPEHHELAAAIVAGGGCLVSELPPGWRAQRGHFPRRNRLIALGGQAVVVVEASLTSGALQTARMAAEWGADVYALPGPWRSERSQGCHRLLLEGARVIESPESLLRDLGVAAALDDAGAGRLARSADQVAVLEQLREGPRPSDFVQRESGLPREAFLRALFELEADGVVQRLAGDLLRVAGKTG
jgi:DNA processing protein